MINHEFKKKYGQNFIFDKNLLYSLVECANVCCSDNVLEIGAGAGTLTEAISQKANRVVSYEIDKDLKEHLLGLDLPNVQFIFEDVMKTETSDIDAMFDGGFKMIANLPYYITTPIIFKFLNESKKINSLGIMVQKEVGERICAQKDTKDYGVLSVMVDFYGKPSIEKTIKRNMFTPAPNVDSVFVVIDVDREKNRDIDGEKYFRFVQTIFSMRRKTLKNNLMKLPIQKEKILALPEEILSKRAENLSCDEIIALYKKIF